MGVHAQHRNLVSGRLTFRRETMGSLRVSEDPIDPKKVAAATSVGVAQRYGTARRRQGDRVAQGAAASGSVESRKASRGRALLWTALFVVAAIVGMLALMLVAGG